MSLACKNQPDSPAWDEREGELFGRLVKGLAGWGRARWVGSVVCSGLRFPCEHGLSMLMEMALEMLGRFPVLL
jgi:hypothetical protein